MTLREILEEDPDIRVIATVENGSQALAYLEKHRPDVITMDVIMPEMDGFETTRQIMETRPVPIVIITSSYAPGEVEKTFSAMEAGAVTILQKPGSVREPDFDLSARNIRENVKLMAGVKVVRRWAREKKIPQMLPASVFPTPFRPDNSRAIKIVAIGASTGGPMAVQNILSALPPTFPAPVLLVQHIGHEFVNGMIQWLQNSTPLPIHLSRNFEIVSPGHVYVAPDDWHMGISSEGAILLSTEAKEENVRPSASYLFRSVARSFGKQGLGVLLSGMGRDGADGLKAMHDVHAVTIAQDEASCIVYGMPQEAVKLKAVDFILNIKDIPTKILNLAGIYF